MRSRIVRRVFRVILGLPVVDHLLLHQPFYPGGSGSRRTGGQPPASGDAATPDDTASGSRTVAPPSNIEMADRIAWAWSIGRPKFARQGLGFIQRKAFQGDGLTDVEGGAVAVSNQIRWLWPPQTGAKRSVAATPTLPPAGCRCSESAQRNHRWESSAPAGCRFRLQKSLRTAGGDFRLIFFAGRPLNNAEGHPLTGPTTRLETLCILPIQSPTRAGRKGPCTTGGG